MSSVKVAVRVRPFNKRELDMRCENIIHMIDNKTIINNPKSANDDGEQGKEFTFDHSYYSFDGNSSNFASQNMIFENLGQKIVSDAIEGYNSCIFAYGQTGSGKTHTMMGNSQDEGLIPRICQWLFKQMNSLEHRNDNVSYKTEIQYMEIYLEQVRDLLDPSPDINGNYRRSLKVREHPKHGPYVEKLSKHPVYSYDDIHRLMMKGNNNRTTASTSMNDTSSRSHAIFTIMFSKACYVANNPYETTSKINLVDLAGSERANSTNAQGHRLVEGSHINKSLVTLGNVISGLAENSKKSPKKKQFIPYRDSVLTWLLKDSLGGNSKTVMVATISPADVNYGETLNTLRYANRAKNILNKPHINEDTNTRLIRELRSEIDRLNSMINQNPQLSQQLLNNEAKVKELTAEWVGKWNDIKNILQDQQFVAIRKSGDFGLVLDSDRPHLIVCVDDDVMSTGVTLYHLNEGNTSIGTKFAQNPQDILINNGSDVENEHCFIHWNVQDNVVTLHPINQALCFVNNSLVQSPTVLHQGSFLVFGENMFRFSNPLEVKSMKEKCSNDLSHNEMNGSIVNHNRPHLVNSTSYDSMYNSISSLNKKVMISSFASNAALNANEDESEISKSASDASSSNNQSMDRISAAEDELEFIKCFLLELQENIHNDGAKRSKTNLVDCFLQIVVKIGNQEQFSKEKILQILSFINKLESSNDSLSCSDEITIHRVGEYLRGRLNSLKVHLKNEMKLDCLNNNDEIINTTIVNENGEKISKFDLVLNQNSTIDSSLEDSTYEHLYQLESEVESILTLLNNCISEMIVNSKQNDGKSTITNISNDNLEAIIENEVQRRLEMSLNQSIGDKELDNVIYTKMGDPTNSLNLDENIDEVILLIPSFHLSYYPNEHYEFEINIGINGDHWTIYRRYSSFLQLHQFIRVQYGNKIQLPYFPPKRWNNRSEKFVETRRRFLENYLQRVIDSCKRLPNCPLNHRSKGLEHLNRICLYEFNNFFRINQLVDKEEFR